MPVPTSNSRSADSTIDGPLMNSSALSRHMYYGWVMLGISILALAASSPGQTYGVTIFNEPMRRSLGLTHSQLASAYMLGTLLASIPIAWIGGLMDRHGIRHVLIMATIAFCGACFLAATAQGWLTLVVAFLFLRLLGPGTLAFLSGNILAYWFQRRLGFVEGMRQLGAAAAMATIPSVNLWMVGMFGWRGAYAAIGIAIVGVLLPLAVIVCRNRPADVGQFIDGGTDPGTTAYIDFNAAIPHVDLTLKQTLRTRSFWIVTGGTAWFGLAQTAVFFSLVPLFQDRSLTEGDAARFIATYAISLAAIHLVAGYMADCWPARFLLSLGMASFGFSMWFLYVTRSGPLAALCGIFIGISQGLFFGASHPLWARYFGRVHLGKIRGIVMTIILAASSAGPLIAGIIRDATGSFNIALILFCVVTVPLSLLCLTAKNPQEAAIHSITT